MLRLLILRVYGHRSQRADPPHRGPYERLQPIRGIVRGGMQQFDPPGFESDLGEQPLNGPEANLRPVVALGQSALPFGTRHDAESTNSPFEGVKEILAVHLAAAWHLPHQDLCAVLLPLARETRMPGNAVAADVHENVRRCVP